ncbi:hypothetical protein CMUS01_00031 [Colletotrichum musicola]|uniref:Uncharacterized protein n=1 Tax=Colletotrichum musicola TaxID=2175873 RepID=A0A8H6UA57_9PEZI|nr:hypothetical protein CMUS01_00031 [Colletotrichum musicola]
MWTTRTPPNDGDGDPSPRAPRPQELQLHHPLGVKRRRTETLMGARITRGLSASEYDSLAGSDRRSSSPGLSSAPTTLANEWEQMGNQGTKDAAPMFADDEGGERKTNAWEGNKAPPTSFLLMGHGRSRHLASSRRRRKQVKLQLSAGSTSFEAFSCPGLVVHPRWDVV